MAEASWISPTLNPARSNLYGHRTIARSYPLLGAPAGQNGRATRVTVDGGSIMQIGNGGSAMALSQEAVQEFQISTVNLDLSTGITASGAVSVVSSLGHQQMERFGIPVLPRSHALRLSGIGPRPAQSRSILSTQPVWGDGRRTDSQRQGLLLRRLGTQQAARRRHTQLPKAISLRSTASIRARRHQSVQRPGRHSTDGQAPGVRASLARKASHCSDHGTGGRRCTSATFGMEAPARADQPEHCGNDLADSDEPGERRASVDFFLSTPLRNHRPQRIVPDASELAAANHGDANLFIGSSNTASVRAGATTSTMSPRGKKAHITSDSAGTWRSQRAAGRTSAAKR